MVILSVSDIVGKKLYDESTPQVFKDVDIVIACGDLPYYYIEFLGDALNTPVLFVRGNHDAGVEYGWKRERTRPLGAVNLHRRVVRRDGIIFAGLEGSMRYRDGKYMYSDRQMWLLVMALIPKLIWNRVFHGRCLDILVTHSPPFGIHDQSDLPHQGFKAIRWLIKKCQPDIHYHGHVRVRNKEEVETYLGKTRIINTYNHRVVTYVPGRQPSRQQKASANGK